MTGVHAAVCIVQNNKILLLKYGENDDKHGFHTIPAGHGEENETPIETAVRETKEETDLTVKIVGLIECAVVEKSDKSRRNMVVYKAESKDYQNIKIDGHEISEYCWATLEDIKNDKYKFAISLIKTSIIKALNGVVLPVDTFQALII